MFIIVSPARTGCSLLEELLQYIQANYIQYEDTSSSPRREI